MAVDMTNWCLDTDGVPRTSSELPPPGLMAKHGVISKDDYEYMHGKPLGPGDRCFMCQRNDGTHGDYCQQIRDDWLRWLGGKYKGRPVRTTPVSYSKVRLKMWLHHHWQEYLQGNFDKTEWIQFWKDLSRFLTLEGHITSDPFETGEMINIDTSDYKKERS